MAWLDQSGFDDFVDNGPRYTGSRGRGRSQNSFSSGGRNAMQTSTNSNNLAGGSCAISEISSEKQIVSIIGLIIAKEGPKTIISKKGSGAERHLIAFTLRDDSMAFINVTCWGGMEYIQNLADTFKFGDVAEIRGAQVQAKSNNPTDEKFKPWTPSSFQLSVSENHSSMSPYVGPEVSHYINLLHIPTRANNDFYTLEDIQENGMNLQGEHINVLALIKKVWPVRELVTKTGKSTSKVDVVLCDETCSSFHLTLWDNFVHVVESWTPCETVIFAADVRLSYSDYRSAMTASTDSKTLFTVDPNTREAHALRQYCKSQNMFSDNSCSEASYVAEKDPEIETITDVMTVGKAKELQVDMARGNHQTQYFVLYAFLSHFDVDGDAKAIFKDVCSKCGKGIQANTDYICENPDCGAQDSMDCEYNLSINLSDHTGTLEHCYVPPQVAELLLGYKASDLKYLPSVTKTNLKWEYLFERVKAVIKMRCSSPEKGNKCFVRLLALDRADSSELANKAFL